MVKSIIMTRREMLTTAIAPALGQVAAAAAPKVLRNMGSAGPGLGARRRAEGDKSGGAHSGNSSSSRKRSVLVHVFLETGESLKISQTSYAFFVSVDRSVVEEFRFGEHRSVNVGQIVGERVSGWDGPVYVVETKDKNGNKLIERFWLSDENSVLVREITFQGRKESTGTAMQFFDRTDRKEATVESGDGAG